MESIKHRLRQAREAKKLSVDEVSEALRERGVILSAGAIRSHERVSENDGRDPSVTQLMDYCGVYEITLQWLLTGEQEATEIFDVPPLRFIPIRYQVGAGGYIDAVTDESEFVDEIEVTSDIPDDSFGVRIIGDSMEPEFFQGDIIIPETRKISGTDIRRVDKRHAYLVETEQGHLYLKRLEHTEHPLFYNLISTNAPTMLKVQVKNISPIKWIKKG